MSEDNNLKNSYIQKCASDFGPILSKYGWCWKDDTVIVYFTPDYWEKLKGSNLYVAERFNNVTPIPAPHNEGLVYFECPIKNLLILDQLLIKTFEFSTHIRNNIPNPEMRTTEPNIVILDGDLVYGMGLGLKTQLFYPKDHINSQVDYGRNVERITSNHQVINNVQLLTIAGTSVNSRKKMIHQVHPERQENITMKTVSTYENLLNYDL